MLYRMPLNETRSMTELSSVSDSDSAVSVNVLGGWGWGEGGERGEGGGGEDGAAATSGRRGQEELAMLCAFSVQAAAVLWRPSTTTPDIRRDTLVCAAQVGQPG
jgi:hypothetical protein